MSIEDDNPLLIRKRASAEISPSQKLANESLNKKSPLTPIYIYGKMPVKPYVRIRDLNNPEGDNDGRNRVTAIDAGIKFTF